MATGYSVSLSPSNKRLVPGGFGTITLNPSGSPFSNGDTFTLSLSPSLGTLSLPVHATLVGNVVTVSGSQINASVTYTAGSTRGTDVLSVTNGQSWTDAATQSFFISSQFSLAEIAGGFFGPFLASGNTKNWKQYGCYFEMLVTGTDAWLNNFNNIGGLAGYCQVAVDGGAASDPHPTDLTALFTGLSDAEHRVQLWVSAGGEGSYVTANTGVGMYVLGAAPVIRANPDYGTYQRFNDAAWKGIVGANSISDGCGGITYRPQTVPTNSVIQLKFKCTSPNGVYLQNSCSTIEYAVDGVRQTSSAIVGVEGTFVQQLAATLSAGEHEICVTVYDTNTRAILDGIVLGSGGSFSTTTPLESRLFGFGDSILQGVGVSPRLTYTDMSLLGDRCRVLAYNFGIAGYNTADVLSHFAGNISTYTIGTTDICLLQPGFNDFGAAETTFKATYTSLVQSAIDAGFQRIICRSIEGGSNATATPITTFINDVVTAFSNPKVVFWEIYRGTVLFDAGTGGTQKIRNIIDGYSADGTHPAAPGYALMAGVESPQLTIWANRILGIGIWGSSNSMASLLCLGVI